FQSWLHKSFFLIKRKSFPQSAAKIGNYFQRQQSYKGFDILFVKICNSGYLNASQRIIQLFFDRIGKRGYRLPESKKITPATVFCAAAFIEFLAHYFFIIFSKHGFQKARIALRYFYYATHKL